MTLIHFKYKISDSDWILKSLDEAKSDPVGMWQIVKAGRYGFGLVGSELENFVRRFIFELVSGGACPVVGDRSAPFGWREAIQHGCTQEEITDSLINEWLRSGVDPDFGGVWFAFPSVWK